MLNGIKGYYPVVGRAIEVDKYYILNLSNLRKPCLLRLACDNEKLALKYIMLHTSMVNYEAISGEEALDRGLKVTKKGLTRATMPTKYCYPKNFTTYAKRKQHRNKFRRDMAKMENSALPLRQFTISYRSKVYTIFEYATLSAYNHLKKNSGMTWGHFIKNVSNKPTAITKDMVYIKSRINMVMASKFLRKNGITKSIFKKVPNIGKIANYETAYIHSVKNKPKKLL